MASLVLRRVRRDQAYASLALSHALAPLAGPQRALATELVYGVLRHRRRLDAVIARHSRRPLERIDPDVLDLVRIAAYQLLRLDRVPAHAAVDQAVALAKRLRGAQVAGFANGVLRQVQRDDWTAVLADRQRPDPADRIALEHSLPDAVARAWVDQLGVEEAAALAERLVQRSPLTVRCNRVRTDAERLGQRLRAEGAVEVVPGRLAPTALRVTQLERPFSCGSYLEGWWTPQDEAAQLVCDLLDPQPGEAVLDACAGVGGKSTEIAARVGDQGRVVATDVNPRKLQLLQEHGRRLGVRCHTHQVDVTRAASLDGLVVDRVLVDAPCSGWGVLRRHPELKWRMQGPEALQAAVNGLVALQRSLLAGALGALRPGGVLVYAVCTITEQEGPGQASWLRERFSWLEPDWPAHGPLALLAADDRGGGGGPGLTLWPHRHDTDGFFMVRFVRR